MLVPACVPALNVGPAGAAALTATFIAGFTESMDTVETGVSMDTVEAGVS